MTEKKPCALRVSMFGHECEGDHGPQRHGPISNDDAYMAGAPVGQIGGYGPMWFVDITRAGDDPRTAHTYTLTLSEPLHCPIPQTWRVMDTA